MTMMNAPKDYLEIIIKVVIALGMLLVIYWGIELLAGGSPTLIQFNTSLILTIVGLLVHIYYKLGKFNEFIGGTFPRFERNIEQSFTRLKEDLDFIKRKVKV